MSIVDGVTGFLVPVQDTEILVEKMEWFIKNQDQIMRMGQASYQLCRDKFDVQKVNTDMLRHIGV